MKQRYVLYASLLLAAAVFALFVAAPFALGEPNAQIDPTDLQGTVNALVEERFQQTLAAVGEVDITATAQAELDMTIVAYASATVAMHLTVEAAFSDALTATAQAINAPTQQAIPTTDALESAAGLRVLLRAEGEITNRRMDRAVRIIERRLTSMGIEANVTRNGRRIVVEMVNVPNRDEVFESIQQTGLLEFVDLTGLIDQIGTITGQTIATTESPHGEGAMLNPLTNRPFETVVTGADVRNAVASDSGSEMGWQVNFEFTPDAGEAMVDFSGSHIGEPIAIVLDGRVLTTPVIQQAFGDGGVVITSNFTEEEARRLALQLNFGSLPVELTLLTIEPMATRPNIQRGGEQPTEAPEGGEPTEAPLASPTPGPSPTPDPRPTATTGQIQIVEQVFENGRMFYIQPLDQIWVMVVTEEGGGEWTIYQDTFEEGDAEFDPSIVPPDDRYQPERGFGKLWRENDEVREALGWGVTPEFGYVSNYRYQPGGEMVNGQFQPGPGYHVLFSLYGEAFRFNESDQTWELNQDD